MDVILNELSLRGQYGSISDFSELGLDPMTDLLRWIYTKSPNINIPLLKKSDFFNSRITPTTALYELLFSREAKLNDRIIRFKSVLANLQNKPYWDTDQLHNPDYDYIRTDGDVNPNVTSTGVAEVHARDGYLLSFKPSDYASDSITVKCIQLDSEKYIPNSSDFNKFLQILNKRGEIGIEDYFSTRFRIRFDFSQINPNHGFNLITNLNFGIFESSFENFEKKTWQQIETDDALDYKRFSENRNTRRYFTTEQWNEGVWKFRIDQEKRCFGTRNGDIFYVWRIDLDHKLSDRG